MSGDELVVTIVCGMIAVLGVGRTAIHLMMSPALGWPWWKRLCFAAVPVACLAAMVIGLKLFASFDVRDSVPYMAMYTLMGVAWVCLAMIPGSMIGLNVRDDVIERRNPAAAWACAGLFAALTLGFTGGNIGDGPGWWVVVFCAILETGTLYLLWLISEPIVGFGESITVERDTATAVRFAALLLASGAVLGRAVAGDWESVDGTLTDFVYDAWTVPVLWVFAVVAEWLLRPGPQREPGNVVLSGAVPGLVYLSAAALWLAQVGWW